ncbi:MAG TPA: pyridoxal-phosphate dependent enzyme [Candidatus Hydrogenedentes bacterium]|nr:pyridoxal-phosphate dependent enzyme [Candidatus Hydrogenedentota bacterium]
MNALFELYPGLRQSLPYVALADLPTPIEPLARLGAAIGAPNLYVKRDDLSASLYGGNKVRKLEFLLGRALRDGRKCVMTFGAAGSNHALATALYARQAGLRSISMLVPQPNARSVGRNLLLSHAAEAELHHHGGMVQVVLPSVYHYLRHGLRDGVLPMIIPPGGTTPLGMAGFVAAAFELKRQVDAGAMPAPDRLYAASGTMGTVIGLLLGLVAAGLDTRVVAVRVTQPQFTSMRKARRFFAATNRLLHRADPSFPLLPFPEDRLEMRHEFYGEAYGQYTEAGMRAVRMARETEDLKLEGTYTGKTFAAILVDAAAGRLRDRTALFWNTYNSRDFSRDITHLDYHALPRSVHRYFEESVQPLDR